MYLEAGDLLEVSGPDRGRFPMRTHQSPSSSPFESISVLGSARRDMAHSHAPTVVSWSLSRVVFCRLLREGVYANNFQSDNYNLLFSTILNYKQETRSVFLVKVLY